MLMTRTLLACAAAAILISVSVATAATIPPGADGVEKALAASPRHGEYVDIALPGSDAKIKSWVVYPERKEKAGVVIVIHEIFGLSDWVRGVADQLAADGFIAIAPDFLSGRGPGGGGTEALGNSVREEIRKLSPQDVNAAHRRGPRVRAETPGGQRQGRDDRLLLGRRRQLPLRHAPAQAQRRRRLLRRRPAHRGGREAGGHRGAEEDRSRRCSASTAPTTRG